ncbi:MAG: cytochrome P450 [Vicinamibacterales bacterium]
MYRPGRDPLTFFTSLVHTYGPLVYLRSNGERIYLVTEPRHVKDILVTQQRKFKKGRGLERSRALLGDGLLTSEGEAHLRQRRLIQPAFHKERIAAYAAAMTDAASRTSARWQDGTTLDVDAEMMRLTLAIVGKTLFDADVDAQTRQVGEAMSAVMRSFWLRMLPFADVIERLPIPSLRRAREARATLDRIVYGLIAERRQAPGDRGDLLSMLLLAHDEEHPGQGMTDRQVRDEAITLFLAGHETTANALAWTWHLLGQSPDVEEQLHAEVDRVLAGRLPTVADIPALAVVEQVVTESMRLYPPAWIIGRRAIAEYQLDDYVVPPGGIVITSPYLTQRIPAIFPHPDRFDPSRWTPAFKAALPPFAYFPFGGGTRRCIGEAFAWTELVLVVATLARHWKLRAVPGHPVVPEPVVTLRLKHGLRMTAHRRLGR